MIPCFWFGARSGVESSAVPVWPLWIDLLRTLEKLDMVILSILFSLQPSRHSCSGYLQASVGLARLKRPRTGAMNVLEFLGNTFGVSIVLDVHTKELCSVVG